MQSSQLPPDLCQRFGHAGSTVQISNMSSLIAAPDDKFINEGEVQRLALDGNDLVIEFVWLAEKCPGDGVWRFVDPSRLKTRLSLELFGNAAAPDDGRFILLPLEPIAHDQLLFVAHDYVGPTGRTPLKREDVEPAA